MTEKLYSLLKEEYPEANGSEQVTIYGAHERIYLNILDERLRGAPEIKDSSEITRIAEEVFDVPFEFEAKGDVGEAVFFNPVSEDPYQQNHYAHFVQVYLPSNYPLIIISTGNRGAVELFQIQRKNYFDYIMKIHELFLRNAGYTKYQRLRKISLPQMFTNP